MRKKHKGLSQLPVPFTPDFINGYSQTHIDDGSQYNIESVNDQGVSGGSQRIIYITEEKFEVIQSHKLASEQTSLERVSFKYHIQPRHRQITEQNQADDPGQRQQIKETVFFLFFFYSQRPPSFLLVTPMLGQIRRLFNFKYFASFQIFRIACFKKGEKQQNFEILKFSFEDKYGILIK